MSATVLHETSYGIEPREPSYGLQRTYTVPVLRGATVGTATRTIEKVRVTVRVDFYPHQSVFRAEVWTPGGWVVVDRIAGDDPAMIPPRGPVRRKDTGIAAGSVPPEFAYEKVDSLEWAAELLLNRAVAVLS